VNWCGDDDWVRAGPPVDPVAWPYQSFMAAVDIEIGPAPLVLRAADLPPPPYQLTRQEQALEWLHGQLTTALARFGASVGLLDPEAFPAHRGGIGILACCRPEFRPQVAEVLETMGCAWTADHDMGVVAHLAGKLKVVYVSSADTGHADAGTAVSGPVPGWKRCAGVCGRVLPLTEFSWWSKARNKRSPRCPSCEKVRQRAYR
jgi:hypothetical protein